MSNVNTLAEMPTIEVRKEISDVQKHLTFWKNASQPSWLVHELETHREVVRKHRKMIRMLRKASASAGDRLEYWSKTLENLETELVRRQETKVGKPRDGKPKTPTVSDDQLTQLRKLGLTEEEIAKVVKAFEGV